MKYILDLQYAYSTDVDGTFLYTSYEQGPFQNMIFDTYQQALDYANECTEYLNMYDILEIIEQDVE